MSDASHETARQDQGRDQLQMSESATRAVQGDPPAARPTVPSGLVVPKSRVADEQGMPTLHDPEYASIRPRRGQIREAVIVRIGSDGVIVRLPKAKRDGFIPSRDLKLLYDGYRDILAVGDRVPVQVLKHSSRNGDIVVPLDQGLNHSDSPRAQERLSNGEVFEVQVTGNNRGGAIVAFRRLRGFVPNSHLARQDSHKPEVKQELVGTTLSLVVIDVDQRRQRLGVVATAGWRDGKMILRWAAAAHVETEKHFRRIMGY